MDTIEVLILIGRPASGKSEIIDYLQRCDPRARRERFHVADLDVLDDFPMLWTWFEEDQLLSHKFEKPRLHTDDDGYFKYDYLWHLLIERLDLDYHKRLRDAPDYHRDTTALIEFSRGSQHGGYRAAFAHLSDDLLRRAAVLYVDVSFAESMRKNRRRYNPERPHSILEHSLPDNKLERLYRHVDWDEFSSPHPHYLAVRSLRIPYIVFENEDDVTGANSQGLPGRLQDCMDRLNALRNGKSP